MSQTIWASLFAQVLSVRDNCFVQNFAIMCLVSFSSTLIKYTVVVMIKRRKPC